MVKWETYGRGARTKEEKKLCKMVMRLNRYAERHNINYAELYILETEGSRTVNVRAKRDGREVANCYAFLK